MRRSHKVKVALKLILFITGIAISTFSLLSYSSLQLLFRNIEIPSGLPEINLNFTHYSKIKDTYIKIPYRISNEGYINIKSITMKVSIDISYTEKQTYRETRRMIFSKQILIGYCQAGGVKTGIFEGDYRDLNLTALGTYLSEVSEVDEEDRWLRFEFFMYLVGAFYLRFSLEELIIDGGFCNECAS